MENKAEAYNPYSTELDEHGNTVRRRYVGDRGRYFYDFKRCTPAEGWKQYDTDQDASYFGVWVNPATRQVLSYAEGDETLSTCPTEEAFHAELQRMSEFYGEPPPAFTVIDTTGNVTKYYDERPA